MRRDIGDQHLASWKGSNLYSKDGKEAKRMNMRNKAVIMKRWRAFKASPCQRRAVLVSMWVRDQVRSPLPSYPNRPVCGTRVYCTKAKLHCDQVWASAWSWPLCTYLFRSLMRKSIEAQAVSGQDTGVWDSAYHMMMTTMVTVKMTTIQNTSYGEGTELMSTLHGLFPLTTAEVLLSFLFFTEGESQRG